MKRFLCYDTNDAASGKINVSANGVFSPNATVPSTNGTAYQQLVTDGKGGVKWEDRLAYDGNAGEIKKIDKKFIPSELNEVILPSSTSGSSKKFKITVNDSGEITATEV